MAILIERDYLEVPRFIVYVFTFIVCAILNLKIAAGRNWARITFFVLLFLSAVVYLRAFVETPLGRLSRDLLFPAAVLVIHVALQGYALILLYKQPADDWFRRVEQAEL